MYLSILISRTLTSLNFNMFLIDWPALGQNNHHLLGIFHCCVPSLYLPVNLELISRFFCWPTKRFMKKLVYLISMLAISLPSCSLRSTKESLWRSPGSRPIQVQQHFALALIWLIDWLIVFETTSHYLSFQPYQLPPLRVSLTGPSPNRYQYVR